MGGGLVSKTLGVPNGGLFFMLVIHKYTIVIVSFSHCLRPDVVYFNPFTTKSSHWNVSMEVFFLYLYFIDFLKLYPPSGYPYSAKKNSQDEKVWNGQMQQRKYSGYDYEKKQGYNWSWMLELWKSIIVFFLLFLLCFFFLTPPIHLLPPPSHTHTLFWENEIVKNRLCKKKFAKKFNLQPKRTDRGRAADDTMFDTVEKIGKIGRGAGGRRGGWVNITANYGANRYWNWFYSSCSVHIKVLIRSAVIHVDKHNSFSRPESLWFLKS